MLVEEQVSDRETHPEISITSPDESAIEWIHPGSFFTH